MTFKAQRLTVEVPEAIQANLERIAAERNVPTGDLINEALIRHVDDEADYLVAVDAALAEADPGIFVSGDRVVDWIRSWGTENALPMPEPDIPSG